jgi:hypothetical protein
MEPIKVEIPERMKQKLMDLNSHIMVMQKQFNDLLEVMFELKGLDIKGKQIKMEQDFSAITLMDQKGAE